MESNRLRRGEQEPIKLPRPAPRQLDLAQFVLCGMPGGCPQLNWMQQELYRWAFAQAQAVVQPSIVERDLLGVWN
jgi:hypothetical protein